MNNEKNIFIKIVHYPDLAINQNSKEIATQKLRNYAIRTLCNIHLDP